MLRLFSVVCRTQAFQPKKINEQDEDGEVINEEVFRAQ